MSKENWAVGDIFRVEALSEDKTIHLHLSVLNNDNARMEYQHHICTA